MKKRIFAIAAVAAAVACAPDAGGGAQAAKPTDRSSLGENEGEPDPADPILAHYDHEFPLALSGSQATLAVSATSAQRGIDALSLRVRTRSARIGIVTQDTTPLEAAEGIATSLETQIPNPGDLAIVEVYVLGHYWHGGVYPLEMQMLKIASDGSAISLRENDDDEEPVIVIDGEPDRSEDGPPDDGGEE